MKTKSKQTNIAYNLLFFRMLRTGSCAFSRLYHRLHESLFSAKLFLTSALHEPIMKVLIEDEVMLDIDPIKAIENFTQKERLKKYTEYNIFEINLIFLFFSIDLALKVHLNMIKKLKITVMIRLINCIIYQSFLFNLCWITGHCFRQLCAG